MPATVAGSAEHFSATVAAGFLLALLGAASAAATEAAATTSSDASVATLSAVGAGAESDDQRTRGDTSQPNS